MLNITLSRAVRNDVNALVRSHPDFEAFRIANGAFDSRDMTKDILMKAIEHLGLENKVRDMVLEAGLKANTQQNADEVDNAFGDGRILASTAAILSGEFEHVGN